MSDPTPSPQQVSLAPQHLRLFALIVDYLLAVVLTNLSQKALLGAEWDLQPAPDGFASRLVWLGMTLVLLMFRDGWRGVSPGRWLTGIAVVDHGAILGQPPAWWRLWARNALLVLLPLEAVLVFTQALSRRLGDQLTGTLVIAPPRVAPATRRLLGLAILFLATMLAILLLETWNLRRSAAYHDARRLAAADPQVAEAVGGAPEFKGTASLSLSQDGATDSSAPPSTKPLAQVTLTAQGPAGEAKVVVTLRREPGEKRWRLDSVQIMGKDGG